MGNIINILTHFFFLRTITVNELQDLANNNISNKILDYSAFVRCRSTDKAKYRLNSLQIT